MEKEILLKSEKKILNGGLYISTQENTRRNKKENVQLLLVKDSWQIHTKQMISKLILGFKKCLWSYIDFNDFLFG